MANRRVRQESTLRVEYLRKQQIDRYEWELARVLRLRQVVTCGEHFDDEFEVVGERGILFLIEVDLDDNMLQLGGADNVQK